ncbi:MAG: N-6 DNA methylase [Candidatus Woesearchaeota archaeon]
MVNEIVNNIKKEGDNTVYEGVVGEFPDNNVSSYNSLETLTRESIMGNERITESHVRKHFDLDPLFKSIKFEEQKTKNEQIAKLLKTASKELTGKQGCPEFIVTFPDIINAVIIIECKADTKDHKRKKGESPNPKKYAVDGILHYAGYLKNDFNVIAIAVSGEKAEEMLVSTFLINKKGTAVKDDSLLTIYDYLNIFEERKMADKFKDRNLLMFASELNQILYNFSVPEVERATIVSGVLIALQNENFRKSYHIARKPMELAEDLLTAIERVLKTKKMGSKTRVLMGEYRKIKQSNNLAISQTIRNRDTGVDEKNTLLRDIILKLNKNVFPFTEYEHIGYDILGQFYSEFIRYVYGDKKLGLVLTPQHVTELFVDIAELNADDVLYDNCCGTAGFLIKGMKKLLELAGNNTTKKRYVKENQLIGVEERSDMFTYACSNMMMRGDGKSNIYQGDSLSPLMKNKIKPHKPTVGFLNPPYSTSVSELEFIYHNLDCLQKNGTCIGIIPMNCVTAQTGRDYEWKKKLLEKHTLLAVFSMPDELFNPSVSTVTAILVFKAHISHSQNNESYFGYWKDDGFVKVKPIGRIDKDGKWGDIKHQWIYNYRNGKEVKNLSIKKYVTAEDEWCAEAYLPTDYSKLEQEGFEKEIKKYILFKELN